VRAQHDRDDDDDRDQRERDLVGAGERADSGGQSARV
jgi:hypothetical protein